MEIRTLIEITKISISLFFLLVSSFFDYKERRVPNLVFILFGIIALITSSIDLYFSPDILSRSGTLLFHVFFSCVIFYAIYYLGFFGAADAILFVIISIIMPWPLSNQTIRAMLMPNLPIFPLSVLNNTLVTSILITPYSLLSNIIWKKKTGKNLFETMANESLWKKILVLLFCIKTNKSKIKPYDMIAEKSGKITLLQKVQEEDLTEEEIRDLPEDVFVLFSIPMVIFITIGFIISIFLGDLIYYLVRTFWLLLLPNLFLG